MDLTNFIKGMAAEQAKIAQLKPTHAGELGYKIYKSPGIKLIKEHFTASGYYIKVAFMDQEYDINITPAKTEVEVSSEKP